MQQKVLSVSVAAYNVGKYITQCLEPFVQADVRDRVEVIVVDDGSSDDTADIAMSYQRKHPETFKVVQKENGGWGSTVNIAIQLATGKYFKQLDGDDYFDSGNLAAFLDELEQLDNDIILTSFVTFVSETNEIVRCNDLFERQEYIPKRTYSFSELGSQFSIAMHQCTFKTLLLKENNIRLLEHTFYTDVELVVKAIYYSKTVLMLPLIVYHYRTMREGQSCSEEGWRKHYKDHENVIIRTANFLHSKPESAGGLLGRCRLKIMVYFHYNLYFHLKPTLEHQIEFKKFDCLIQEKYPEYDVMSDTKSIRALRRTGFLLYIPMCWKYGKSRMN